jgi:hypothetical protein
MSRSLSKVSSYAKRFSTRSLLTILVLLLIAVTVLLKINSKPGKIVAAWWDESWAYRRTITVSNSSGSNLTDFQIAITIDTAALITAGKMKSDCSDIRLTDNNSSLLPVWLETYGLNACNSTTSKLWTKLSSLPTSGATVYLYYGNSLASSTFDGNNVFMFFDDFDNSSIDTNKWNQTGSLTSISNQRLRADRANGTGSLYSKNTFSRPFVLDMDFYPTQYPSGWEGTYHGSISFGTYNTSYQTEHTWVPYGGGGNSYCGLCDDGGCYHGPYVNPVTVGNNLYKINMQIQPTQSGPIGYMTYTNRRDDSTGSQASSTVTTGATTGNDPLYIGLADYGNNVSDDLEWDNWRVRKYAAVEPTIATANEEKSPAPVGYWKFDEGAGTVAYDSTKNASNGTISSTAWQTEDQCVSGKCLQFNGSNSVITVTDPTNNSLDFGTGDFTVEFWINYRGTTATNQTPGTIINKNSGGSTGNPGFFAGISTYSGNGSNYGIVFSTTNGAWGDGNVEHNGTYNPNTWYHVTGVRSGNTFTIYKNGKYGTSVTKAGVGVDISNAQNFKIGGGSWGYVNASIDDVKVYPYARTVAQIKSDYASGLNHVSTDTGISASLGSNNKNESFNNGLVAYWKMNENTGTSLSDSSGNNRIANFGTGSSVPTWNTGKFASGLNFNGTQSYVDTPDLNFTGEFTYSLWINNSDNAGTRMWSSGSGSQKFGGLSNKFFVRVISDSDNAVLLPSANSWHHIVLTRNSNDKVDLYIDGQTSTRLFSDTVQSGTATFALLGNTNDGSNQLFMGKLDEVRLYNRALSPSEVQDLYNWAPGPIAYYDFNEGSGTTVNDKSGNSLTGTASGGSTWTSGKYGSSLYFDGVNDTVVVNHNSILEPKSITVGFWAKIKSDGTRHVLVTKWTGFTTEVTSGGVFQWGLNGLSGQYFGSKTVPYDQWIYLTSTYDDQTKQQCIYFNGIQQECQIPTGSINYGQGSLQFSWSSEAHGNIDDIKIYNYARTTKQIVEDMNGGHPVGGSPVGSQLAYYKFDEGYGNTVNNWGNGGNGMTGIFGTGSSSPTWNNNGKYNKAISFDGNDFVQLFNSTLENIGVSGDFSVTVWNYQSSFSGTKVIVGQGYGGAPGGHTYGRWQIGTNGARGWISLYGGSSSPSYKQITGAINLSASTWNQISAIFSRSEGKIKLYINGKLDSQINWDGYIENVSTNRLVLGYNSGTNDQYMNGIVDEVKFYNVALTDEEIKIDYNRGSALQMGSVSSDTGNTAPSTAASQEYCVPGDTGNCAAPIAQWKMDEKTGTTAYDTSGSGNNSTLGAGGYAPTWTQGKFGSGLKFDGVDDRLNIGSTIYIGNTDWTVSAWIKTTSTGINSVLSNQSGGPVSNDLRIENSKITYTHYNGAWINASGTSNVADGKWHFLTWANHSNQTIDLYVDGVKETTASSTIGTNGPVDQIGRNWTVSANAYIDQVRVYNYSRTPAQIAWEYNRGNPVGWWKFDECQGNTASDWSYKGNAGAISIGGGGSQTSAGTCTDNLATSAWNNGKNGKYNSSLNFDGTDDRVTLGNPAALQVEKGDFSVSAWVYPTLSKCGREAVDKGKNILCGSFLYGGWSLGGQSGNLGFVVSDSVGQQYRYLNFTSQLNRWYHLVGIRKGNTVYLYADGKLIQSDDITGFTIDSDANLSIGGNTAAAWLWPGQIDDVRLYNYALTSTQVKTLFTNGAVYFGQ